MLDSINFIKERRKLLTKKRYKDKKIFLFASIFFGVVVLISVVLVGINLFLTKKIDAQKKYQRQLDQVIKENQSVQLQYQLAINKLKIVSQLFGERKNKQEALDYFSSLFDSNIKISGISYNQDEKSLVFSLSIPSIFQLKDVLDTLDSDEIKDKFGNLEKSGISRGSDGGYSLGVKVYLNKRTK